MRQSWLCISGSLLLCSALLAQSAKPTNPVKLEFENARVRVSRVKLGPGETLAMRSWMPQVQVPLTSNDVSATCKDMPSIKAHTNAGFPQWSGGAECSLTNGSSPFEAVVVELKEAKDPAKPLLNAPMPRPEKYLEEPSHHWAFENQYVRVFDVHLAPGTTSGYHLHALDTVFVQISGGTEGAQVQGSQEWADSKEVAGKVSFLGDSQKARIHRVRNQGQMEYHVIAIQLLP